MSDTLLLARASYGTRDHVWPDADFYGAGYESLCGLWTEDLRAPRSKPVMLCAKCRRELEARGLKWVYDVGPAGEHRKEGMSTVTQLLSERGRTHGHFAEHAAITQSLKSAMHGRPGWARLNDAEREALEMIVHKIGRVLAGNPHFHDHWLDIAGYAQLVADSIAPLAPASAGSTEE